MNLTDAQRQAVGADAREVLVIAGAGSGKTRVLTQRIIRLLDQGVGPRELLVLTFTRRAANEMQGRLLDALGNNEAAQKALGDMLLGTFHAIALRILQTYGDRIGYRPTDITVCDPNDMDMLLEYVCRDLGFRVGKNWRHGLSGVKVRQFIEDYYVGRTRERDTEQQSILERILADYHSHLRAMHVMDFGQLLQEVQRLFREHPDVLEKYNERIKYVLVDESQDSDLVQYNLHDFFAPPATFMGVGDRRQSVYSFRGARPDLMTERRAEAQIIDLRECFRCSDRIVAAANNLIAHNDDPLASPMIGATGRTGRVETFAGRSLNIAEKIKAVLAEGYAPSEIAVLARTHRTLRRLASLCQQERIPYHRAGRAIDVTGTEAFRNIHAVLRLYANRGDNMAFVRLAETFGVGRKAFLDIRALAAEKHTSWFDAYWVTEPEQGELAVGIQYGSSSDPLRQVVGGEPDGDPRPIPEEVQFWRDHCADMTIAEALTWFATYDPDRGDDAVAANAVTLITAHASKGLEWPVVILMECNEGSWPSSRSLGEEGGVEEERRLFYVGMTRAREWALMHHRRAEDQAEERGIREPSRFLGECDATAITNAG